MCEIVLHHPMSYWLLNNFHEDLAASIASHHKSPKHHVFLKSTEVSFHYNIYTYIHTYTHTDRHTYIQTNKHTSIYTYKQNKLISCKFHVFLTQRTFPSWFRTLPGLCANHRATLTTWKKKVNSSGILGASLQNSPITTTVGKLLDVEFLGTIGELLRIIEELLEKYVC